MCVSLHTLHPGGKVGVSVCKQHALGGVAKVVCWSAYSMPMGARVVCVSLHTAYSMVQGWCVSVCIKHTLGYKGGVCQSA